MVTPVVNPSTVPGSSIYGTNSGATVVINDILDLIIEMLGTLQQVAATQANRLNYYSELIANFTDEMNDVPNVLSGDLSSLDLSSSDELNLQSQISTLNQAYSSNIRNYRDVVTDKSQSFQSLVNQSNQEVSQQADLGSTLLTQLSTILQTMFSAS